MKRIVYSIYTSNIEEHTSTSPFKRSQFEKFKDRLKQRQEEYAKICGAQYKLFEASNTDFINIQFEKLILFTELSKEYDEVLYLDFDVIPITDKVLFDNFDLNKICGYRLDRITEIQHKIARRIKEDSFDRMNMFCKTCCKKAMLLLEDINLQILKQQNAKNLDSQNSEDLLRVNIKMKLYGKNQFESSN